MRAIIPIYPPAIFKDPRVIEATRGLRSPITIEHSLIDCSRCGEPGWIGPKQRAAAQSETAEVICIYCFGKDPDVQAGSTFPMISLNPDIESVPRRDGSR